MIIGFDGKRAFQNRTGLGNYSRSLISILAGFFQQHQYVLFAPKQTNLFQTDTTDPIRVIPPPNKFYTYFSGLWRRYGITGSIKQSGVNIYHGLSNELPQNIRSTGVKSVVTIHDLIFERFPATYNFDERYSHRWKIKHACKVADAIIAISNQTKEDLVKIYNIAPGKIFTCYQSCNPIFEKMATPTEKSEVKNKYTLPGKYFLFVSSITARKNLLLICKALVLLKGKLEIPLVVIGNGKKEKEAVKQFMSTNGIAGKIIFLNEQPEANTAGFISAKDFPAIYQQAVALIYPSIFEGFGLPVLEALWSGTPVICSDQSSLPEVGGDAVLYFDPADDQLLSQHMIAVATNENMAHDLRTKGLLQAQKFSTMNHANNVMKVYKNLL